MSDNEVLESYARPLHPDHNAIGEDGNANDK